MTLKSRQLNNECQSKPVMVKIAWYQQPRCFRASWLTFKAIYILPLSASIKPPNVTLFLSIISLPVITAAIALISHWAVLTSYLWGKIFCGMCVKYKVADAGSRHTNTHAEWIYKAATVLSIRVCAGPAVRQNCVFWFKKQKKKFKENQQPSTNHIHAACLICRNREWPERKESKI